MNCKDAEREMLLAETGELSRRKLDELEAHISACAACSGRRQGVRQIVAAARHALPGGAPSPAVIARIRAAAADRPACGILRFRQPLFQALAYAAALALLAGGWFLLAPNRPPPEAPIHDVRALLHMVSDTVPPALEARDHTHREQELRALAQELLIMEGLAEESWTELEEPLPTSDAEPAPTALRWRSTGACPLS